MKLWTKNRVGDARCITTIGNLNSLYPLSDDRGVTWTSAGYSYDWVERGNDTDSTDIVITEEIQRHIDMAIVKATLLDV